MGDRTPGGSAASANPYVGPRAFRRGETLYGRDREARRLLSLLSAERIVLLYSPSGAGKTSLIHASLIPALVAHGFQAPPAMRVNLEPPPARLDGGPPPVNRYLLSALLSLEEGLGAEQQTPLADLAGMHLTDYLERRRAMAGGPRRQVLIFDQFEEVLTLDPTDPDAKRAFFEEVGEALLDARRWALFSLREDYVAGLDPYRLAIPTDLGVTFRLDFLGVEEAREAIQRPAERAGFDFADEAADRLIDDLRTIKVQAPSGAPEPRPGPYVEPVHLQVVCHRLWEMRSDRGRIDEDDIAALGDVDRALADYYAAHVERIAAETGVSERAIRTWIDDRLITEQGLRGQALLGSQGLDSDIIRRLEGVYLIRAETRRGATWLELAHDRLIEPVRQDNAAWFHGHLSALQRQADLWQRQARPGRLLLHDQALVEADHWASDHAGELTPTEREFLDASRQAMRVAEEHQVHTRQLAVTEARAEAEARANRRLRLLAVGLVIVTLLAFGSAVLALLAQSTAEARRIEAIAAEATARAGSAEAVAAKATAEAERQTARSRELAQGAVGQLPVDPELSVLLAREAIAVAPTTQAEDALRTALALSHGRTVMRGHGGAVRGVAFSPDGALIVTAGDDGAARIWAAGSGRPVAALRGHTGLVTSAVFSPDGRRVATTGLDGGALLWETTSWTRVAALPLPLNAVRIAAFSPNGRLLVTAGNDAVARVWEADAGRPVAEFRGHADQIFSAAFSPDGARVVTSGLDTTARIWEAATGREIVPLVGHGSLVFHAAFSPDGRHVVTASRDFTARVWEVSAGREIALRRHTDEVVSAAFSPDGRWVASASIDRTVRVWEPTTSAGVAELRGHAGTVFRVAFSPDGRWLATASEDGAARLWQTGVWKSVAELRGHADGVTAIAFSPDGRSVATASDDGTARTWQVGDGQGRLAHDGPLTGVAVSPDGAWVVTASLDRTARVWEATTGAPVATLRHEAAVSSAAFGPDRRVVTASRDGTARVWEAATGRELAELRHAGAVNRAAFSPDGRLVVTASEDGTARVWEAATGRQLAALIGHTASVGSAAFSPDGQRVATASRDGTARLWEAATGREVAVLRHAGIVSVAAFSPDGRRVVTAGDEPVARLWEVATAREVATLKHDDAVVGAAFSPDGALVATASKDRTAGIWEAATGLPVARLRGHTDAVTGAVISPDGRWVATTSADVTTRLWAVGRDYSLPELRGHTDAVVGVAFGPDGRRLATAGADGAAEVRDCAVCGPIDDLMLLAGMRVTRSLTAAERERHGLVAIAGTPTARPAGMTATPTARSSAGAAPTATPTWPPTAAPTRPPTAVAERTVVASQSATPASSSATPIPVPASPCRVVTAGLNLRGGPGLDYESIRVLTRGVTLLPLARLGDGLWIRVQAADDRRSGWVRADPALIACGDIGQLPIGAAPVTPTVGAATATAAPGVSQCRVTEATGDFVLRAGPGASFEKLGPLRSGDVVRVLAWADQIGPAGVPWFQVATDDDRAGWIRSGPYPDRGLDLACNFGLTPPFPVPRATRLDGRRLDHGDAVGAAPLPALG